MSSPDLETCGRLDVAQAYRRLADRALAAANNIASADSAPGEEDLDYQTVENALLDTSSRRGLLAAARRGTRRGTGAA